MNEQIQKIQNLLRGNLPYRLRQDARTLVIGLGGAGCKFVGETKALLTQRYGEEDVSDFMNFYCLDSDPTQQDRPSNMSDREYYTMNGLNDDEWIEGWLNPIIRQKRQRGEITRDAAAGQTRMAGRWQFISSSPTIQTHLRNIISVYHGAGQLGITHIYVIIMGSLCGGTCCGTFIDVAYLIRKIVSDTDDVDFLGKFSFFGMLELPDSKIDSSRNIDKPRARANAYAAMKDLEYYMRPDTQYELKIPGENRIFTTTDSVFTRCFLLSNNAVKKGKYDRNDLSVPDNIYLSGAIPEAVYIMISETIRDEKNQNRMFGFESYMHNLNAQRFRPDPNNPENRMFVSTFGSSKIESPKAKIIHAVFSRIFIALENRWDKLKDDNLVKKVGVREIPNIFDIEGTYKSLTERLNLSSLDIESKDCINNVNAIIRNLNYDELVKTSIRTRLEEVVDRIYTIHGPFLALKVFESNQYGPYLDKLLEKTRPSPVNPAAVQNLWEIYYNIKGPFSGKSKADKKVELRVGLENYAKYMVYSRMEQIITELKTEINVEYHNGLFTRVTNMVKVMQGIFNEITGIKTETLEERNDEGTTFTWKFSDIPYDEITKKINFLFGKKVVYMENGNRREEISKGKIYPYENGYPNRKKELFYWDEDEGPVDIEFTYEQNGGMVTEKKSALAIEEVMQFGGEKERDASRIVSIEAVIQNFLHDIKTCTNSDPVDIYNIILTSFWNVINRINTMAFEDMIILFSPGIDPSRTVDSISDKERETKFIDAINKFNDFALPSFPVHADYLELQNAEGRRNFSVRIQPALHKNYQTLMDNIRGGIIAENDVAPIIRDGLYTMLAVNFYFDYPFEHYAQMKACKRDYDAVKNTDEGAGLHIAEGQVFDIRPLLRELVYEKTT